ncbi:hypothetical protein ES332_D05G280100v1 [Gossypium tomentosum]|uniref:protein phosphatase methylesterase-1 n=1 Tax=Gossypium tomentosum TaxID=34277 RepID=A0A5D2L0D0_GOSTO|nr:hypothetical protein ES332_D05G280100v1 [Gossypium tomentosum]
MERKMSAYQTQMMSFIYIWQEQKDQLFFVYMGAATLGSHLLCRLVKLKRKLEWLPWTLEGMENHPQKMILIYLLSVATMELKDIIFMQTMCNDVFAVLKALYGDSPPAIVLVGHSMGGSVAVHIAAKKTLRSLAGLVVVDVVEGTAMASLVHMQKILSGRMQHFSSIEKAIEWSVRGGSLRNIDSARVSIPTTLKYDDSKNCYVYRARLEETEQYWRGWYEGLSEKFLSSPVPKLLLLAGTDRLDRALTIGQMQGKFQMVVVRHTGHAIQEDVPDEFATLIINFISRNRIGPHGVEIPGLARPNPAQAQGQSPAQTKS